MQKAKETHQTPRTSRTAIAIAIGMMFAGGASAYTVSGSFGDGYSGVAVTITDNTQQSVCSETTDSNGAFTCASSISDGTYRIDAQKTGYAFYPYNLTVNGADLNAGQISLYPDTQAPTVGNYQPAVTSKDGLTLTLQLNDSVQLTNFATAATGFTIKEGGNAVNVTAAALGSGSTPTTLVFTLQSALTPGATVTISYDNTSGNVVDFAQLPLTSFTDQAVINKSGYITVAGQVKDGNGNALNGSGFVYYRAQGSNSASSCPSNGGNYSCDLPANWRGQLEAGTSNATGYLFSPKLLDGTSTPLTDDSAADFSPRTDVVVLTGRVLDSNNAPLSSANWGLSGGNQSTSWNCSLIDSNGNYRCSVDENVNASLSPASNSSLFTGYAVPTSGTATHDFVALATRTVSGTLKNLDGSPIANAWVYRWLNNSGTGCVQTDSNGNFSCLVPDGYTGKLQFRHSSGMFYGELDYASSAVSADLTGVNAVRWPTISGLVKDGAGNVLSGVSVSPVAGGNGSNSDANGFYTIAVPPGFTGALRLSKSGYLFNDAGYNTAVTADVTADETAITAYLISGVVKDSSGAALSNVSVNARPSGGGNYFYGSVDSSGNYSIALPLNFTGTLNFFKAGYLFNPVTYTQVSQNLANITVQAQPAWLISGKVYAQDGATPLANYVSVIFSTSSTFSNSTPCGSTDASGNYVCAVPQGFTGYLRFSAYNGVQAAFSDVSYSTAVTADQANQTVTAITSYAISGTVTAADGTTPLTGVLVQAMKSQGGAWTSLANTTTDSSGHYSLAVPQNFSGKVLLTKLGSVFNEVDLSNVQAIATQNASALAGHTIAGVVKDGSGQPLVGVQVGISKAGSYFGIDCVTTASDGAYTCVVPTGATNVRTYASKTGYVFASIARANGLTSDESGADIVGVATPLIISGNVTDVSGNALTGVSVSWYDSGRGISKSCGYVDSGGTYTCAVPQGFSGTVSVYTGGGSLLFTAKTYSALNTDSTAQNFQAVPTVTLSGKVAAADGTGLAGLTVVAMSTQSGVATSVANATTDSSGNYSILAPKGLVGYLFVGSLTAAGTSVGKVFHNIIEAQPVNVDTTGLDFTAAAVTHAISGKVLDANGAGLSGAWMWWGNTDNTDINGCGVYSDSSGNYSCLVADGFTGHVGAGLTGYQGAVVSLNTVTGDLTGNDITLTVSTGNPPTTDTAPDLFTFTAASGAALSAVVESAPVTIAGINSAAPITVSGGEYAISTDNGSTWGAYTSSSGSVSVGNQIKARLTASSSYGDSLQATITIGGISGSFRVTTGAQPSTPADNAPTTTTPPKVEPPVTVTPPTDVNVPSNVTLTPIGSVSSVFSGAEQQSGVTAKNGAIIVDSSKLSGTTPLTISSTVADGVGIVINAPKAGEAPRDVAISVGGKTVTITPSSNTLITTATMTINGVAEKVLVVTSGDAKLSASSAQQVIGAVQLPGSSTPVLLTANDSSAQVSVSSSSSGSGLTVSKGSISIRVSAFANGFAADGETNLIIYAGEKLSMNNAGQVTAIILASSNGKEGAGDAITAPAALAFGGNVPLLNAPVERLSGKSLQQAVADALGATLNGNQSASGVLNLSTAGGNVSVLPVGAVTINPSKANGLVLGSDGLAAVSRGGVTVKFAPAVADPLQLAGDLAKVLPGASVTINACGTLIAKVGDATYAMRPDWLTNPASGSAGFSTGADGVLRYLDAQGNQTALHPAFLDPAAAQKIVEGAVPGSTSTITPDGSITLKAGDISYTLTPDFGQPPMTSATTLKVMNGKTWWVDNGKLFINSNGGVQAISVR